MKSKIFLILMVFLLVSCSTNKKEKQKYDDLRLETLQAELDLIKDITEIANEATGVKEVGTRLGEKIRRNRETAISESDEDIYSLMRELQESEWNEQ